MSKHICLALAVGLSYFVCLPGAHTPRMHVHVDSKYNYLIMVDGA